jgi:hypothetical protein
MFFVWRVLVLTREERSPQRWLVAVVILLCAIGQLRQLFSPYCPESAHLPYHCSGRHGDGHRS